MPEQIRVGYDLDGVAIWFAESVWDFLVHAGLRTGPCPPVGHWNFFEDDAWGNLSTKSFVELCHAGVDAGFIFNGDPIPGTKESMNELFDLGHRIVIVTDRSFGENNGQASRRQTFKWLREHGFMFHEVHFTADKTTVDIDTMVDDKVENFEALTSHGVECYLIDRPWNQHVDAGTKRISDISEYTQIVKDKSE